MGIYINDEHLLNIKSKLFNFDVFHFEISGNITKKEQLSNIYDIVSTFEVFHLEIPDNDINDVQPSNMLSNVVICEILISQYQANLLMMNNLKTFFLH